MSEDSLEHTSVLPERIGQAATRKVWLPRLVYECLPYFYILAGVAALFATLYINAWYWVIPHWILFTALCLHFGVNTLYRRFRYRSTTRDADAREG